MLVTALLDQQPCPKERLHDLAGTLVGDFEVYHCLARQQSQMRAHEKPILQPEAPVQNADTTRLHSGISLMTIAILVTFQATKSMQRCAINARFGDTCEKEKMCRTSLT